MMPGLLIGLAWYALATWCLLRGMRRSTELRDAVIDLRRFGQVPFAVAIALVLPLLPAAALMGLIKGGRV